jgi:nicotinate-nucleotide adenylyltransferase
MRIGLLGGTFNPIHRCHLAIARETRDRLRLNSVIFIPCGDPPHKPPHVLAPARHRLEMVRRAVAGDPSLCVSDFEVTRLDKSYSIDTVHAFRKQYGHEADLFFITGLDAFLDFPTWKQASDFLRSCHFVVVGRPGAAFASLQTMRLLPPIDQASLAALDAEQINSLDIPLPSDTRLILLRIPPCRISASHIRERLRHRQPVSDLLPAQVESYIMRWGLYQEVLDHRV